MASNHGKKRRNLKLLRRGLAVCAVALVLLIGAIGAQILEAQLTEEVENAGMQMTPHTIAEETAQVFMNGQWYQKKNVETLLVIGIDNFGAVTSSASYNNTNQADFMMLFVRDTETGKSNVIHLNRDTMTDITVLGVTGKAAGTQRAQLALAYNYGQGQHDSSKNTMDAVSNLLYGTEIDHYITVTMDAVPVLNDWADGVTLEVMVDMTSVDNELAEGKEIKLNGKQALDYIRTRKGLEDSSNINRMKRQRQYAYAWMDAAKERLKDENAVAELVMKMSDYHHSDCTAQELADLANALGENPDINIHELPGESVKGETYMEFYADDEKIQQMVLDMFYTPIDDGR